MAQVPGRDSDARRHRQDDHSRQGVHDWQVSQSALYPNQRLRPRALNLEAYPAAAQNARRPGDFSSILAAYGPSGADGDRFRASCVRWPRVPAVPIRHPGDGWASCWRATSPTSRTSCNTSIHHCTAATDASLAAGSRRPRWRPTRVRSRPRRRAHRPVRRGRPGGDPRRPGGAAAGDGDGRHHWHSSRAPGAVPGLEGSGVREPPTLRRPERPRHHGWLADREHRQQGRLHGHADLLCYKGRSGSRAGAPSFCHPGGATISRFG